MSVEEQQYMNCTRQTLQTLLYGHDHLASEADRPHRVSQCRSWDPHLVSSRVPALSIAWCQAPSSELSPSPNPLLEAPGLSIYRFPSQAPLLFLTLTTNHQTLPFWPLLHLFDSLHFQDPPSPVWTSVILLPGLPAPSPAPANPSSALPPE